MRFADFDQFATRHPEIAEILEHPHAEFLKEMKRKIENRENLTPKQFKALKKWADRESATSAAAEAMPGVGHVVRDTTVSVTKVFTSDDEGCVMIEFLHPEGWRGRIKDVKNGEILGAARDAGFEPDSKKDSPAASGGTPFNIAIEKAHVIWAKPEAAFVILGQRKRRRFGASGSAPILSLYSEGRPPVGFLAESIAPSFDEDAINRAAAELGTTDTRHEWEVQIASGSFVCIHCGEVINDKEIFLLDVPISRLAGACPSRTEAELVPEPELVSEPELVGPRSEREQLLPDFDDWRSKLSL